MCSGGLSYLLYGGVVLPKMTLRHVHINNRDKVYLYGLSALIALIPLGCSNENMVYVNKSLRMPFPKIINFDLLLVSFMVEFFVVFMF